VNKFYYNDGGWFDGISDWFSGTPSYSQDDAGLTALINANDAANTYYPDYTQAADPYALTGFDQSFSDLGMFSPALDRNEAYSAAGQYVPNLLGSTQSGFGGTSLKDWGSLGLGGLSLLGNYLSKGDENDLAEKQLRQQAALAREKMALEREAMGLSKNTDLAKTDAIMQLINQRQPDSRRYAELVSSGQMTPWDTPRRNIDVRLPQQPFTAAGGGMYDGYAQGGAPAQGALSRLVQGASGGQADEVNAALSHGEYIMDSDVVSALGDGNTEAGAAKLDKMRENIRQHKRSAPKSKIPPKAKSPEAYMKGR
jgi:hypothetical protein